MNDDRRKKITEALANLAVAKDLIEEAQAEEQQAFDNLPESMQSGDKGNAMEEIIGYLEEAGNNIEEVALLLGDIE